MNLDNHHLAKTYNGLRKQIKELDKQIKDASIGTPEYYVLMQKRKLLDDSVNEIEGRTKSHRTNGGNYTGRIGDNL